METEAIVLNVADHGESDCIVTRYSRHEGRFSAIAKGARRSLRRFVNKLEIFSFLTISYSRRNPAALAFLAEAEIITSFISLRQFQDRYMTGSVIEEFLLLSVKEGEPDERIFHLALWSFNSLDRGGDPRTVLALFLIRFFGYIGYHPELQACTSCGENVTGQHRYAFSMTTGGIICAACGRARTQNLNLTPGTLRFLASAQTQAQERLHQLKAGKAILDEALHFLHFYGGQLLQRDINSWRFFVTATKKAPAHAV